MERRYLTLYYRGDRGVFSCAAISTIIGLAFVGYMARDMLSGSVVPVTTNLFVVGIVMTAFGLILFRLILRKADFE